MVEGDSGFLNVGRSSERPTYEPSKRRLTWANGAVGTLFSAEEPDRLRGPQCDCWWADEVRSWANLQETWDNLQLGARLGDQVRGIVTTTPRPLLFLRELSERADVALTRGSTFENKKNLSPSFLEALEDRYSGTRLGRQEVEGDLLADNPGALWRREWIEENRVIGCDVDLVALYVGLDPSATSGGDEAGVVVAGRGSDGRYYVIGDHSLQGPPHEWAKAALTAYYTHGADKIIYERNQGGEMVKLTLRTVDHAASIDSVWASRGKATRAQPIAALYEQGRVSHVGRFDKLEDELCQWADGDSVSPNRLDALVWVLSKLHFGSRLLSSSREAVGI